MDIKVGDLLKYANLGQHTVWEVLTLDNGWFTGRVVQSTAISEVGITGGPFHIDPAYSEVRTKVNHHRTKLGKILYK